MYIIVYIYREMYVDVYKCIYIHVYTYMYIHKHLYIHIVYLYTHIKCVNMCQQEVDLRTKGEMVSTVSSMRRKVISLGICPMLLETLRNYPSSRQVSLPP
jgi:hypothetical protein